MIFLLSLVFSLQGAFSQGSFFIIDNFNYKSEGEARSIWVAQGESSLVSIKKEKERNFLLLDLNFPEVESRCYWDRDINLDLSGYEKFLLKLMVEEPAKLGHCTLYFRSPGGWFAYSFYIEKQGWQEIILPKSKFTIEENPAGWHHITGIRLSFWKPSKPALEQSTVLLGQLKALPSLSKIGMLFSDVTIRDGAEAGTARRCFENMGDILESFAIDYKEISESSLEEGREPEDCEVLILPYNPYLSAKAWETLVRFVENGGKIMVFYSLSEPVAKILGIKRWEWRPAGPEGKFDRVRFNVEIVDGLPGEMRQGSWNAIIPMELSEDVKIIGEWLDMYGSPTGLCAATLNDKGFYFGHILLNRREGKQMVLSILAELSPNLKRLIIEAVKENTGKMPGTANFEETKALIMEKAKNITLEKAKYVRGYLRWADINFQKLKGEQNLGEIFRLNRVIEEYSREAYCRVFSSRRGEFRGVWCHSAFGVEGWSWDRAIRYLKENNFNAILVNMLWAGLAYYPSEILPVAKEVAIQGDQIAQCLSACKEYGVECHIWKVNWNLANAPSEFIQKLRSEGRLQMDKFGREVLWLCPSNPENFKLEVDSMLEVVRKYDVDGIHFDYIRYPDANSCYCPGCKERFEKEKGLKVENWPEEVISGQYKELYAEWRREQITRLVKTVSEEARKIKPSLKISAAVFGDYLSCRETVGQDWKAWIEAGYLDFVCPMDYTNSDYMFKKLAQAQKEIVGGKIPLYTGIGAYIIPVEQLINQIEIAREVGAEGFVLFNYDKNLVEYLPFLSKGVTSEPGKE